ncbi:MAG TPA: ribonuclease P protein component [Herbaspirillum sp.]|nr:ribonuclease P protein component [Herbaspirillum sp.]
MTDDHSHLYSRDRRIVKTDEFSSVFRLRPVYRSAHFILYARNNDLPLARLGVITAKRMAPRAVTRNMIKRIIRESFRQAALPQVDCIVRLFSPVNSRSEPASTAKLKTALRAELLQLFTFLLNAPAFAGKSGNK